MILTCHLLAGAAVASRISNPFLALPLAILSHYFLDSLPHVEYPIKNIQGNQWKKSFFDFLSIFLDILFGIMLINLLSGNNLIIFAAAFLAASPDVITLLGKFLFKNKLIILHQKFHIALNNIGERNKKIPKSWGILTQIIIALTAIFLLR